MASFLKYIPLLQRVEGGFQIIPDDPGNYNSRGELVGTNYGISARFYEDIINRPPTEKDMRAITKSQAQSIFRDYFWDAQNANYIHDQSVANTIIDHQINAGNGAIMAQQVLRDYFGKNIQVDGQIGPKTLNALNSVNPREFVEVFNAKRAEYYRKVGNPSFLKGWLIRLKKFAYNNRNYSIVGLAILAGIGYLGYQKLKN